MKKLIVLKVFCIITVIMFTYCEQEKPEEQEEINVAFSHQIITQRPIGVNLKWAEIPNAETYIIYKSLNTIENYMEITNIDLNEYTDEDVSWGTKYYYRLTVILNGKEKIARNDIQVIFPPEPKGLTSDDSIWLESDYIEYTFPENANALWFKFTSKGNTLRVRDKATKNYIYTSDIVIDIQTYSNKILTTVTIDNKRQENIDTDSVYALNWLGLYYVIVRPKDNNEENKGTFAICFN